MNIPENPFYDISHLDWVKTLEDNYALIKDELLSIIDLKANTEIDENCTSIHPKYVVSEAISDTPWKTYDFIFFGIKQLIHCENCPKTFALLQAIPELITAQFSILQPNTEVRPHMGYSRMILRNHLPLVVPEKGDMGIRVKDETRVWQEGKLLSFYDAFDHEAWNRSDERRAVLMFDIAHPDCGYSADEINTYKIENIDDPFLLKIADKAKWKSWLNQGYFN